MMTPRLLLGSAVLSSSALVACVAGLDSFVHNPTHCSTVGPATCEEVSEEHLKVCAACDAPYPWEAFGIPADVPQQVLVTLSDDKKNDAYFIPSSGAHPDITVVYTHGNRTGIEHYLNRIGLLYKLGVNLFVVEYRGYGKSEDPNKPSEAQLYDDTLRARAALDTVLDGAPSTVYYYGYSVGALPALQLALDEPPCGLLLEAPWPSVQAFSNDSTHSAVPASFLTVDTYDNIGKIGGLTAPLLLVHGTADDFILIEHSETLFAAAPEPKEFIRVEGAGHGNYGEDVPTVLGEEAYLSLVEEFVTSGDCAP